MTNVVLIFVLKEIDKKIYIYNKKKPEVGWAL